MRKLVFILAALCACGLYAQDFSDAPSPYPTAMYFQNGGGTRIDCLGTSVSDDSGTPPVAGGWTGDDADDGCEFLNFLKGSTATLNVAVVASFDNDDLAVWMDFNDDGDWDDAGERVIWAGHSSNAPDGAFAARVQPPYGGSNTSFNTYQISVPVNAVGTTCKVRVRLWDTADHSSGPLAANGGGSPSAYDEHGEVEDYEIPYGTSTGAKAQVRDYNTGADVNPNTTYNAGNLTAGVSTNLFFNVFNLASGTHFLRFTTATPQATIVSGNEQNCTVSLFTPANGVTLLPGNSGFTFIATVTPGSSGQPFSFDVAMPTNDPLVPVYIFTVSGNGAQPAPKLELQRPAYTTIASGGSDNVGQLTAGSTATISWYIFNNGNATLNLTGNPLVAVSNFNNCSATVSGQPPATNLPGGGWSMTFAVNITPTTAGSTFSFEISIASDDPNNNPYTISVTGDAVSSGGTGGGGTGGGSTGGGGTGGGTGGGGSGGSSGSPAISVDRGGAGLANGATDSLGFIQSGGTTSFFYTVTDSGSAPLSFTGNPRVAISGESNCTVAVTQQLPAGLAAGANAPFALSVTTSGSGSFSFTVTIANDSPGNGTYSINVQGSTGTHPPVYQLQLADGRASSGCTMGGESGAALLILLVLTAALVWRRSSAAPVRKR